MHIRAARKCAETIKTTIFKLLAGAAVNEQLRQMAKTHKQKITII